MTREDPFSEPERYFITIDEVAHRKVVRLTDVLNRKTICRADGALSVSAIKAAIAKINEQEFK